MRQKDQSSHSISSFSYSAGGIYTSNQPMNIRSKNSTYFSKNNENYLTNHQFTQDEEDCNSVNS